MSDNITPETPKKTRPNEEKCQLEKLKSRETQGRQHLGQRVDLTLLNFFDILASLLFPVTSKIGCAGGGIPARILVDASGTTIVRRSLSDGIEFGVFGLSCPRLALRRRPEDVTNRVMILRTR